MPVNSQHAQYEKMLPRWKRCRDVAEGQDAVHAAGATYLPRLKDQTNEDYDAYVARASFYNATWRTLSGLVGMMFRQPPIVEVPAPIAPMLEDVTLDGIPLQAFVQTVAEEALMQGRVGVLVDCPPLAATKGAVATQADAIAQNIRPTLQLYRAETILNWRQQRINNRQMLTLIVLQESEDVPTDEYASKAEERFRELSLVPLVEGGEPAVYRVRMFKRENDKDIQVGEDVYPKLGGSWMTFIPFLFISTDDLTPDVDVPPLIDLVNTNLSHYRVTADYEHGCHFTALPTAVVSGYKSEKEGEKLYIGSSAAWVFPNADASANYLEFTGQGLSALVDNLKGKEQHMAILGARMLEPQKKAAETSDSASIHRKGEESMLSATAQTLSMGITRALTWFCEWAGSAETPIFELNRDFYPMPMDSGTLMGLVSAWQQGAISDQTLFENLQQGEVIAPDVVLEDHQAQIANRQSALAAENAALFAATQGGTPE